MQHKAPVKVAIVGSRNFFNESMVRMTIASLATSFPNAIVVSGGAAGVDSWAESAAELCNLRTKIFIPDWDTYGKSAGPIRNSYIVQYSDLVIAFWDGQSRGTKNTIDRARKANKLYYLYNQQEGGWVEKREWLLKPFMDEEEKEDV